MEAMAGLRPKMMLSLLMWCMLASSVMCCRGNSNEEAWSLNVFQSSCSEVEFDLSLNNFTNAILIGAVQVSGPYSLKISEDSSGFETSRTTDGVYPASICIDVSSQGSFVFTVTTNATLEDGESFEFYFYYGLNYYCEELPPSPGTQDVFMMSVTCPTGLTVTPLDAVNPGFLTMGQTTATALPAEYYFFNCNGQVLYFERTLSDTQYLTTKGVCQFGQTCQDDSGSVSWSAVLVDDTTSPSNSSDPDSPFIHFEGPRQISTKSELNAVTKHASAFFPLSQLGDFVSSYPPVGEPKVVVSNYEIFPQESEEALVTFNIHKTDGSLDFYYYMECDEDDEIFECSELSFSAFFPDFSLVVEEPASWEEQKSFQLFEAL